MNTLPLFLSFLVAATSLTIPTSASARQDGAQQKRKEWTFLIFLNGFNNLDQFGYADINEMERVGSTDKINIVVQWASLRTKDVKRLLVEKDTNGTEVTSPVIETIGKADMGSPETLMEFAKWGVKNFPAEKYFINVWDHGSGWHKSMAEERIFTRDISHDDLSGNVISTEELGQSLRQISAYIGGNVSIYGSDACLMGMVEVAAEMKDAVDVFVGSQELEPGDGWPYDRLLARWSKLSRSSAREVAKILTEEYVASYQGQQEITLSAYDLRVYGYFMRVIGDVGEAIQAQAPMIRESLVKTVNDTFGYYYSDYKDVGDLLNVMSNRYDDSIFSQKLLTKAKGALRRFVVSSDASEDYSRAHGVSIWLPEASWSFQRYAKRYAKMQFNLDSGWMKMVSSLYPER